MVAAMGDPLDSLTASCPPQILLVGAESLRLGAASGLANAPSAPAQAGASHHRRHG
jgi:hypothetical protein